MLFMSENVANNHIALKEDPPSEYVSVIQGELSSCPDVIAAFLLYFRQGDDLVLTLAVDLLPDAKLKARQELIIALNTRLKLFPQAAHGARVITLSAENRDAIEEQGLKIYRKRGS